MTIGIYSLYWREQDLIYIGQSTHVQQRKANHMSLLSRGEHYNYKLQKAYNLHGTPNFTILEECSISALNILEEQYISEFNSVDNGLNIALGGNASNLGYNSPRCKSTKEQLASAFDLLANTTNTYKEISELTGVSIETVKSIRYFKRHTWLIEEFPEMAKAIKNSSQDRLSRGQQSRFSTNKTVISPDGVEYIVTNACSFAIAHNLNKGHFCSLLRNELTHHKKWTLKIGGSDE